MTKERVKKLRSYQESLLEQQRIFSEYSHPNVEDAPVRQLGIEISQIENDFPGLVPPFNPNEFFSHSGGSNSYYKTLGIRSYLARAIIRIRADIEGSESTPGTQSREFPFVKDDKLRRLIDRDYSEIQRAYIAESI